MTKKIAVIDLGTNTFNLLIAEIDDTGKVQILHKDRRYVMLAEDGIERIGVAAFQRGLDAMEDFRQILAERGVTKSIPFGTAALRTAQNGVDFAAAVLQKTGMQINIISGDLEAELICKGVRNAYPHMESTCLIMDIGGGSVEFILCDASKVFWAQSFPIGVAVLKNHFHHQDPMAEAEINLLFEYLGQQLSPLKTALKQFPTQHLIGASGTFDVLEAIYAPHRENQTYNTLELSDIQHFTKRILPTTMAERLADETIPDNRCSMIVVAMLLMDFILQIADIQKVTVSGYAMKEGILFDEITK